MDYYGSEDSLADQLARRYEMADVEAFDYATLAEPADSVPEAG